MEKGAREDKGCRGSCGELVVGAGLLRTMDVLLPQVESIPSGLPSPNDSFAWRHWEGLNAGGLSRGACGVLAAPQLCHV